MYIRLLIKIAKSNDTALFHHTEFTEYHEEMTSNYFFFKVKIICKMIMTNSLFNLVYETSLNYLPLVPKKLALLFIMKW